ncbi:hypothetical protein JHK87_033596 [Glycine soja]|nr:hypothetical protein JHK87_033596 [Glycine soja]
MLVKCFRGGHVQESPFLSIIWAPWLVSCLAFIQSQECTQGFLLSGSGDFTVSNSFNIPVYFLYDSLLDESNVDCFSHVRLWNIDSGALLDTCEVAIKRQVFYAATDLCTVLAGLLVAVPIQSLQGIVLLSCSVSAQTLSVAKVMAVKHAGNDH